MVSDNFGTKQRRGIIHSTSHAVLRLSVFPVFNFSNTLYSSKTLRCFRRAPAAPGGSPPFITTFSKDPDLPVSSLASWDDQVDRNLVVSAQLKAHHPFSCPPLTGSCQIKLWKGNSSFIKITPVLYWGAVGLRVDLLPLWCFCVEQRSFLFPCSCASSCQKT